MQGSTIASGSGHPPATGWTIGTELERTARKDANSKSVEGVGRSQSSVSQSILSYSIHIVLIFISGIFSQRLGSKSSLNEQILSSVCCGIMSNYVPLELLSIRNMKQE